MGWTTFSNAEWEAHRTWHNQNQLKKRKKGKRIYSSFQWLQRIVKKRMSDDCHWYWFSTGHLPQTEVQAWHESSCLSFPIFIICKGTHTHKPLPGFKTQGDGSNPQEILVTSFQQHMPAFPKIAINCGDKTFNFLQTNSFLTPEGNWDCNPHIQWIAEDKSKWQ